MYRVMLLDDEPYVRQMLREMAHWERCGFAVAAECINGEDALKWLRAHDGQLDLVLCDLRMPVMDGLAFIRHAKKDYPMLQYTVISAYDDFHLVREAFLLGAREYLLKAEMTAREIDAMLIDLREQLRLRGGAPAQQTDLRRVLEQNLFAQLASGAIREPRQFTLWSELAQPGEKRMLVLCMRAAQGDEIAQEWALPVEQWLAQSGCAYVGFARSASEKLFLATLEGSCAAWLSSLRSFLERPNSGLKGVDVGASRAVTRYEELPAAISESLLSCDGCFLSSGEKLIVYTPRAQAPRKPLDARVRLARLNDLLYGMDAEQIDEAPLFLDPYRLSTEDIPQVKELYLRYQYQLSDFFAERACDAQTTALCARGLRLIKGNADLAALNDWLRSMLQSALEARRIASLIQKLQQYILRHYAEDITLTLLAERFYVSPSYISRLFRKELDANFVDYLSKVRIEQALRLMTKTNLKLYEICEQVGYHNPEHFSRTFKRLMGCSPKVYMSRSPEKGET